MRSSPSHPLGTGLLLFFLACPSGRATAEVLVGEQVDPHQIATDLSRLGPRQPGTEAHEAASELLMGVMRRAGLEAVQVWEASGTPQLYNLTGVLPGASELEIVLSAHYDTVAASPGAADNASGCGVVLAAVADLARTPLRHNLRVILFDGEESGLKGSARWVKSLDLAERDTILANLTLDLLAWEGSREPVLHTLPVRRNGGWALTPSWLVHAVLEGSRVGGRPLKVIDPHFPWIGQLAVRMASIPFRADSDSFLSAGVPSILLSDASMSRFDPAYHEPEDGPGRLDPVRLGEWSARVASIVRRLDGLSGRPVPDEAYLVLFGRVWHRRALYWTGFLLWVILVWRGIPGRWRGAEPDVRRRLLGEYLPAFVFRVLFLVCLLLVPVFTVLILFPAALLALVLPSNRMADRLMVVLGWLPAATLAVALTAAQLGGWLTLHLASLRPILLVGGCLVALTLWRLASGPATRPPASRERP